MLNPVEITNFNASKSELEELILFWICASGKNGITAAKCLNNLLSTWKKLPSQSPFDIIRYILKNANLSEEMKKHGIGCYSLKSKAFKDLTSKSLDLKECSVDDLEGITGVGPKTARCFLIHSRKNQNYAGLDVHILRFLREKGHETPKTTPTGKKYKELEKIFLKYVKESGMSVADFDLKIWSNSRKSK